jgi:hypothetical protein
MNAKGQSAGIILALFGLITVGLALTVMAIVQSQLYSSLTLTDYTIVSQQVINKTNNGVMGALNISSILPYVMVFGIILSALGGYMVVRQ